MIHKSCPLQFSRNDNTCTRSFNNPPKRVQGEGNGDLAEIGESNEEDSRIAQLHLLPFEIRGAPARPLWHISVRA